MISTLFVLVCSSLNVVCSPEDLRPLLQHKKQHVVTLFVTSKLHVLLFWNANKLNYWFWDTWNDAVLLFSSQKLIQYFTHNASPPKYWVYLDDCDRSLMTLCSEEAVTTRVHFFTQGTGQNVFFFLHRPNNKTWLFPDLRHQTSNTCKPCLYERQGLQLKYISVSTRKMCCYTHRSGYVPKLWG